jgi:hypothetical protein
MYRLGLVVPVLGALLLAAPVAAATTTNTRYAAPIDSHGITGRVVIGIDADKDAGILKWDLAGLPSGKALVIDVDGGKLASPRGDVVWHRTEPLSGTSSSGEVALPAGSAGYFLNDLMNRDGVNVDITAGHREAGAMFHEMS